MSKLSSKLNEIQAARAPKLATDSYIGTKEQLIDQGQLPRHLPVSTSSVDENGVTTTIFFDSVPDNQWNVPVWRLKRVSRDGKLLQEFKATNREQLILAVQRASDEEYAMADRQEAYDEWLQSPTLQAGRWFADWNSRLCDDDQQATAEILKKYVRMHYGERGLSDARSLDATARWVLDNTTEFDMYITHSENLSMPVEPQQAHTPHERLRTFDDTARRAEDVSNKSRDLGELKRAAIPTLSDSRSSVRERKVTTIPSGTSRKL